MSMPPRSRTGSGPLIAGLLIVLAIVIALVAFAATGITPQRLWDGFFPIGNQTPVTDRSLSTKALYDFVFYIAAAIFLLVEGVIIFSAFRFRRKPGDDELPPQTHGNNLVEILWTLDPDGHRGGPVRALVADAERVDAKVADASTSTSRAVAARFQWSFDYLDGNGNAAVRRSRCRCGRRADPESEGGGLVLPVGEPIQIDLTARGRHPRLLRAASSCSSATSCPGSSNKFDFTVDEPGTLPRPVRGAVRHRSTAR